MTVLSISLNKKNQEDIETIKETLGYSGRSEVVRAAIRSLNQELRDSENMQGDLVGVVSLVHGEHDENNFVEIKHKFDKIIETHLHSKIGQSRCLELLIVKGSSEKIKQMLAMFRSKKMEHVRLTAV
jgi:CopG family nickel-responsive transcriptional regulator